MLALSVQGLTYVRATTKGQLAEGFELRVDEFSVLAGSATGIVGPSGCGKSTLIDLFALLRRPTSAKQFEIQGQCIQTLWRSGGASACTAFRARHIGVVLQTGGLLASLPVWDNVMLSQYLLGISDAKWSMRLLKTLGLDKLLERLPGQLSVGQRQRVAIARALAHRPSLVFADEPTAALGVEHAPAAMALLLELAKESGAGVVIVSHDKVLLSQYDIALAHCALTGDIMTFTPAARCDSFQPEK